MLLTPFAPTRSFEGELLLKGMGVYRHIDGDLHSMIHPPEESINPEGEDHPAFHHDGQGNLLPVETGAHPIDGVIKMLDSRLEEYRAALSERAQQGDETAARLLQDLQGWSGGALVDEAIRLHNQKHPNQQLPPKGSPEYRKNTIDTYPDRNTKGNVFLNDGTTLVNYWSNRGVPKGKPPGFGYESGAIHFAPELHDILNNSAFMQAVRYLAQTGTSISGMNERTPPEMLTSQAHLQQDMGHNYINPHMLSSHPGQQIHRFSTTKGRNLDMPKMAKVFGFEDQMLHPEGLHPSQVLHHLPHEFFSRDNCKAIDTTEHIAAMMSQPEILARFAKTPMPGGSTLADYNTPEGIQILSDVIAKKPAISLLFGNRDRMQEGSAVDNLLNRHINSLDEEQNAHFGLHKESIGSHGETRGFGNKVAALANVLGAHPESPSRSLFHDDSENHEPEKDARSVIEALSRGHMMLNGINHHTPRPDSPITKPPQPTAGVPYGELVGSHNHNLAQQGVYGHSPPKDLPVPKKDPVDDFYAGLKQPPPPQDMASWEFQEAGLHAAGHLPEGQTSLLRPWDQVTTSAGWDSAKALARSDDLRKFWKCVR